MVWAATWSGRRFCVCGEMSIRFRKAAQVNQPLIIRAAVESSRPRLLQTSGHVLDSSGDLLATATGKYVPLPQDRHESFLATMLDEASTAEAAKILRIG